ncbi:Clavaminate synthase-like protein [Sporormia fimetaria CBS 119925]|uniref:Clavaminate synthase-like protein n=1 Tax=Sporormia fimetaria CBS 119925 TaxID=1340428 RepID=A0A6A6VA65_9PLEO|nr:Clavaminate synthase-like protein [Sporormia fimetaria CBS 119925]
MAAVCASYHPSPLDAARFWEKQRSRHVVDGQVPSGYPKNLTSPLVWTREEAEEKNTDWFFILTGDDIDAVNSALSRFEGAGHEMSSISTETFALPHGLSSRLREVSNQCYRGIGFQVLRGLDPSQYTAKQNAIVYAGIAAHIAPRRGFLDIEYERVMGRLQILILQCQVRNFQRGRDASHRGTAPAFTDAAVSFHTDNCEILSLYCLSAPFSGGRTLLASSWQIYNELAKKNPKILKTLTEPWVLDTFKDYSKAPPVTRPLLEKTEEASVLLRFSRYPVTGWQRKRSSALPAPTQVQIDALDALQFLAASNCISLPMEKGDMVFINDMALVHARESFDEDEGRAQRHLLKMYLHDPSQHWPVAPSARSKWARMYGANRPNGERQESFEEAYDSTGGDDERAQTNG